jgi:hypothetical protein
LAEVTSFFYDPLGLKHCKTLQRGKWADVMLRKAQSPAKVKRAKK